MNFAKNKCSLTARCSDIFNSSMPDMKVRFKGQYLDMNSSFYSRTVSLNFTYRFGGYKKQEVKEVDTELFTAWIRGEFRFDNTSVEEIFTILQRWYHIDVFYTNDAVRREVFTGKLPRFENLQVILDLMENVSPLHFERKGNTIFIQ